MKLFLLTFILSFISICGFSQIENFNLSQYKLADYNFQSLENTLLFNGSYLNGKDQNSSSQNSQSSMNFDFKTKYRRLINSRGEQSRIFINSKLNYLRSKRKGAEIFSRFSADVSSNFDRKFFHRNKIFTGIGNKVSFINSWDAEGKNSIFSQAYLPFSAGIGRVENVTDAWLGVRLLNDLTRLSILKETPSDEQILALAKFISERQNLRFFDSRLKRIEDIEQLDAFLRKNGLVDAQGAKYFNSLYDQWLFGANTMRQSGSEFIFRISPYGTLSKSQQGDGQIGFGGLIGFEYADYKPLNLKWQFNKSAGIHLGSLAGGVPDPVNGLEGKYSLESQVDLELGYFPNSRTFMSFNLNSAYKISDESYVSNRIIYPIIGFGEGFYSQLHLTGLRFIGNFQTEYYFSPQTRLQGGFNFSFIQNSHSNTCGVRSTTASPAEREVDCFQLNYELQFTHSFF